MKLAQDFRSVLLISLLFFTSLEADWEEYTQPCLGDATCSSIPGIDFIYMINLLERPEKLRLSQEQFAPYDIVPYRFEAINGWKLDEEVFFDLVPQPYLPLETMTPGRYGILLSYLSVLQDAYENGYQTVWIMEDDIDVIEDPRQLSTLIESLDEIDNNWDLLYTDVDTKNEYGVRVPCRALHPRPYVTLEPIEYYLRCIFIGESFMEIGMRYGAYSIIIRRSGIKKIIDYYRENHFYIPLDMDLFLVPNLRQIALTRDIVSVRTGIYCSDTTHPLIEPTQIREGF